jgi:threonylcarbamoyladenosine tRNA methylthiotransferase MtaB
MRVAYHTFGCKANQYDTERMRQEVEAHGATTESDWRSAEVLVVNTCTVTNQADADARRFVRRVQRENPGARVVVAGCSAVLKGEAYRAMDGVAGVVEGHDPESVLAAVAGWGAQAAGPTGQGAEGGLVQLELRRPLDRIHEEPIGASLLARRAGATRGWLKVQDGCDRKCSFCATRLARGESRSRPPHEVRAEARVLAQSHPELVVTGIHIGHYGLDLDPRWTLGRLVAALMEDLPGTRFRLGSVEATEIDDLLLDLLADPGNGLAPHLHMPLQSGADPVLRRMRRWHTREMYRTRALEIAERVPTLGLGADIITGFPGETDLDHADTRTLVEELPYTYLHVFPYSPRDGTAATTLPDPVPQRVAGERARELRILGQEKGLRYRAGRHGQTATVTLEGGGSVGLTGDFLRVGVAGAGASPEPGARGGPESGAEAGSTGLRTGTLEARGTDLYIHLTHSDLQS